MHTEPNRAFALTASCMHSSVLTVFVRLDVEVASEHRSQHVVLLTERVECRQEDAATDVEADIAAKRRRVNVHVEASLRLQAEVRHSAG